MLGLNGVVVKSHGGADAQQFAYAMDVAIDMVEHRFNDRIREGLQKLNATKLSGESGSQLAAIN